MEESYTKAVEQNEGFTEVTLQHFYHKMLWMCFHAEPINWDVFLEKEWLLNPENNPESKNYGVSKN